MATKSMIKNIVISTKQSAHVFMDALMRAEQMRYKPAKMKHEYKTISGKDINEFFRNYGRR